MRLRHPDLDEPIDAPDDPNTIAVHKRAGWIAEEPAGHDADLAVAADLTRDLIEAGDFDGADQLIILTVHHGGIRPWEMFAAGGSHRAPSSDRS